MMIKDFSDGMKGTVQVLVKSVEEKKGGKRGYYYQFTLTDSVTECKASAFDMTEDPMQYRGKICEAELIMKAPYYNLNGIRESFNADVSAFVEHAVKDPRGTMDVIKGNAANIKDDNLRMITERLLNENEALFMHLAAGKFMHHNCINGLLYHVFRMLLVLPSWCKTYHLDRDLMTAGVILHDIGKVKELETDELGNTKYTVLGTLFGHLYMGARMIEKACEPLGIDPEGESVMMLLHMIVSHHGKKEYGAIQPPAFAEARALHMIDDWDAKAYMFEHIEPDIEPGCVSDNKVKALDEACVYRRSEKMSMRTRY